MKVQRCATARASAFAASVRATRPASVSCMENTASVITSPASGSEGSCVEVSNRSNQKKTRKRAAFDSTRNSDTAGCREECV